jgi:glutamate dehydrogenase
MRKLWAQIESLDNRVSAKIQYEMMYQTSRLLRHATYWLLAQLRSQIQVDHVVKRFGRSVAELQTAWPRVLIGTELERYQTTHQYYLQSGVPAELAGRMASMEASNAALDIATLALENKKAAADVAQAYFAAGKRIGLDWLRVQIEHLKVDGPWQAIARSGLRDSVLRVHRHITQKILARSKWVDSLGESLTHWERTLTDMRAAGANDFATLSVGVEAVRKLAD